MNPASSRRSLSFAACRRLVVAGALVATASIAHATNYDEVVSGDLSGNAAATTDIGALTSGLNRISGTTIPSGTFDTTTLSYSVLDNDYVTFTVPTGYALSSIVLGTDSIIQSSDRLFMGIAKGSTVSVNPSFTSAAGLLGWTLVSAMSTDNLVTDLGASAPANFPAIGGATGFTGPLASGQYTLWILDGDAPVYYDFKLSVVQAVPEPASWAMMAAGMALAGFASRRRVRR